MEHRAADRRRRSRASRTGARLAASLVGVVLVALTGCTDDDDPPSESAAEAPADVESPADAEAPSDVESPSDAEAPADPFAAVPDIIDAVLPSTVSIEIQGGQRGQAVQGAASGVIWDGDGLIVTNAHVVGVADELTVVLADGQRHIAEVVASDERTDLAVVAVDATGLPAARFADELPRIGQLAIAIGNPLGFTDTATAGIISGIDRSLPVAPGGPVLVGLLQTDAPISSGNSGGALVDADGVVMGINVAAVGGAAAPGGVAQNLGFAIPSTTVASIIEELVERGEVAHAYLGVQGVGLNPRLAEQFGHERDRGVLIGAVEPGSPADDAGLRQGDVIAGFDGGPVESLADLLTELRRASPDQTATLTIVRRGEEEEVDVMLGEIPDTSP